MRTPAGEGGYMIVLTQSHIHILVILQEKEVVSRERKVTKDAASAERLVNETVKRSAELKQMEASVRAVLAFAELHLIVCCIYTVLPVSLLLFKFPPSPACFHRCLVSVNTSSGSGINLPVLDAAVRD